ncbi:hypothetical protein JCGZ_23325 [Jatropha curcas]|uniref:PWWP domain-containing protein n=1 Tax=Jatropha curcas TaxID=180498 RepID=A0A067JHZ0_JATCU|nr:uncharacterized protein LOC105647517 [Jatropha curcas]KDP23492.1 hypothetical protein JCGZ_23325 [Jatropha curcas]
MISIVKNDSELDTKANAIEQNRGEARVSGDGVDSPEEEKARVSGVERGSRSPENEDKVRVLETNGSAKEVKAMAGVGEESDVDSEMGEDSRVYDVRNENNPSFVQFDLQNDRFESQQDEFESKNDQIEYAVPSRDTKVEVYTSLLSEFDDFVANEKHGALVGTSRALTYGFEVGDMVWGKVKSHPWWPGHIFNEAFASSSVRRTRREGYVLVAFFGDSSYGWFDPAELIPFDPHLAEKSQQTNSRNFVKAVEEAVDEASRRCGLGVACRCRNKYNFRPTNVPGYFEVDVPDFEPGVYSVDQIRKAQDAFRPGETLAFVKQLALGPQGCDRSTIEFIKNKATVFAFRKALFEEFDETYAQAFGVQPKRPASDSANASDQPVKAPTRAPLSGPLVIAEALGSGKSSKKSVKVKDHSKKDRYLFKRRDEPVDSRTLQFGERLAGSSAPAAYEEGSSAIVTGDYVLQKRAPTPVSAKNGHSEVISNEVAGFSEEVFGKEAVILDQGLGYPGAQATQGNVLDEKLSLDKEKDVQQETKDKMGADVMVDSTGRVQPDISIKGVPLGVTDYASPSFQHEGEATVDIRYEESAKVSRLVEGSLQTGSISARVEGDSSLDKFQDGRPSSNLSSYDAKHAVVMSADVAVKKAKVLKRPLGDLGSENSVTREKKKKKKKDSGTEISPDHPKKRLAGAGVAGKSSLINVASREDHRGNQQKKDVGTSNAPFSSVGPLPMVGMGNIELELPHLLSDLHALALNPYHGTERNGPSITMQFFLRFRSHFYQKSLALSPPSETETNEIRAAKFPSSAGVSGNSAGENVRDLTSSKPVKSLVRPDDPMRGGRKRLPSDRQEEIAARKLKKISMLKSLAAEKKAGMRTSETHRTEGKEPATTAPAKPVKSDSARKMESQPRAVEPTMLVMKFPPQTNLPSAAQLKAKFARFGSIDQSAIRVFWQTSTCRVVFRHKLDAQAAYKYAVNNTLFGNLNVRYSVREVGAPASEAAEADKGRGDDTTLEAPRVKDPAIERPPLLHQAVHPQSTVQLKSILKKPTGDEAGQVMGGNGGRGTARVKFMLGGEETSRGEQLMVGNRNFNNNASFADGGAPTSSSSSVAMDFNSKNFQKVIPPSPIPPPLPSQYTKLPLNNSHHIEVAPRNMHNLNIPMARPTIDISQQMLSLLTRCNDVVTTVTSLLGYVPYHPL